MKKFISTVCVLLVTGTAFAQKTSAQLEKEVADLQSENQELSKQNLYYRQTLDLLQPLASASADRMKFDIVKAEGSKSQKVLKVQYIYSNTAVEVRPNFTANTAYLVDPRGNQTTSFEAYASNNQMRVEKIEPGTPMKGLIIFKLEEVDFPVVKLLNFKFENINPLKDGIFSTIIFRNIPVIWTE